MVTTYVAFMINKEQLNTLLNLFNIRFNFRYDNTAVHCAEHKMPYSYIEQGDLVLKENDVDKGKLHQVKIYPEPENLEDLSAMRVLDTLYLVSFPYGCQEPLYNLLTDILNITLIDDEYNAQNRTVEQMIDGYIFRKLLR